LQEVNYVEEMPKMLVISFELVVRKIHDAQLMAVFYDSCNLPEAIISEVVMAEVNCPDHRVSTHDINNSADNVSVHVAAFNRKINTK